MEIFLVRHGETAMNVSDVFRGQIDVGLNEKGLGQAEKVGEYLSGFEVEAVYTSPLKRAVQVADAIARRHSIKAIPAEGINDLDFGDWQGVPRKEVMEKYPEQYREWIEHPEISVMPNGEGMADVRDRAVNLVNTVLARHEGNIVLVSHRVVHNILICMLLGLDISHFWNIYMDTCGITRFICWDGSYILKEHNNTSFLQS